MDTFIGSSQRILLFGELAHRSLLSSRRGKVLASVSRAEYLSNQFDEICWLIHEDGPKHPRGIQVSSKLPRLKVGCMYKVEDHTVIFDSGTILDFSQAVEWHTPASFPTGIVPIARAFESLAAVIYQLLSCHQPTGLGRLAAHIIQNTELNGGALDATHHGNIAGVAWPLIQDIIRATTIFDGERLFKSAASLIGLGEGLTPSGDDFLGGYIFALLQLFNYYSGSLNSPVRITSDLIIQSRSLTNPISYAILMDHANGYSVEALHGLCDDLLTGKPINQVMVSCEQLISLGHSTGWDILTGFTAAWFATVHAH